MHGVSSYFWRILAAVMVLWSVVPLITSCLVFAFKWYHSSEVCAISLLPLVSPKSEFKSAPVLLILFVPISRWRWCRDRSIARKASVALGSLILCSTGTGIHWIYAIGHWPLASFMSIRRKNISHVHTCKIVGWNSPLMSSLGGHVGSNGERVTLLPPFNSPRSISPCSLSWGLPRTGAEG